MLFARIYWRAGATESSEALFKESISLYEEFNIPLGVANCCKEYSNMLLECGRTEDSYKYADKARELYGKLQISETNSAETLKEL